MMYDKKLVGNRKLGEIGKKMRRRYQDGSRDRYDRKLN